MKNIAERKRHSFVLIEVIIAITLMAALVVNYVPKVTDVFDKPKDLKVTVDLRQYEAAAMNLMKEEEPFTEDKLNECVDPSLMFTGSKSSSSNPYGESYKLQIIDEDNFKIISSKIKDGKKVYDKVLTVSRDKDKFKTKYEESLPPDAVPVDLVIDNITDYYIYYPIEGGYGIELSTGFDNALNSNIAYKEWNPGQPLPNPGSTYNDQPVISMSYMFWLNKAPKLDLSKWDTSNVQNMSNMFAGCLSNEVDLSSFDTSKVVTMECYLSVSHPYSWIMLCILR